MKAFRKRSSMSWSIWLTPVAIIGFSMRGELKELPASARNLLSRSLLEKRRLRTILPPINFASNNPRVAATSMGSELLT